MIHTPELRARLTLNGHPVDAECLVSNVDGLVRVYIHTADRLVIFGHEELVVEIEGSEGVTFEVWYTPREVGAEKQETP